MPVKTNKSALLTRLEALQTEIITPANLPSAFVQVYDGGLLLHSVLSKTTKGASYGTIARNILSIVLHGKSSEVHVCLDRYEEGSIKDSERKMRGAVDMPFSITGADQTTRQNGQKLLTNGTFKNEFSKFLLKEWGRDYLWNYYQGKTLFASYGGECYMYTTDEHQHVNVSTPGHLQGDHEEADTLIAFHIANISSTRNIIVRASDTDILVIVIGALGQQRREDVRPLSWIVV